MRPGAPIPEASREQVRAGLRDGSLVVVNVLPREAFEAAHIPGSLHLPLSELAERAPQVLPDRVASIVVYCASPT